MIFYVLFTIGFLLMSFHFWQLSKMVEKLIDLNIEQSEKILMLFKKISEHGEKLVEQERLKNQSH